MLALILRGSFCFIKKKQKNYYKNCQTNPELWHCGNKLPNKPGTVAIKKEEMLCVNMI